MIIHLDENEDLIDICLDNVFKAVFTKDTPESLGALAKLLSAVTGRKVESVSIAKNEPPIDDLHDRQIRFDVHCKASNGIYFNVEISMNPDAFEPVRLEFYTGKLFTGQNIRGIGKTYDHLQEVYQIAFLASRKFFGDEEPAHSAGLRSLLQAFGLFNACLQPDRFVKSGLEFANRNPSTASRLLS
jgi:hypothetical protein